MSEKAEYTRSEMEAAVAHSRMVAMMMVGDYVRSACVAERRACAMLAEEAGYAELAYRIRTRIAEEWQ